MKKEILLINRTQTQDGQEGFTLIEVMIAIMVLTIGILGMMVMQMTAITSNNRASTITTASAIAASQVETLRNTPFNSIAAGNTIDPATSFPISWTVGPTTPALPDTRLITVTVTRPQGMAPVVYNYTKFRDL